MELSVFGIDILLIKIIFEGLNLFKLTLVVITENKIQSIRVFFNFI